MSSVLPSWLEHRLVRCRRDFVLQLVLRDGPFWDAIAHIRRHWGIEAIVEVPVGRPYWGAFLPEQAPAFSSPEVAKFARGRRDGEVDRNAMMTFLRVWEPWMDDISRLFAAAVPRKLRLGGSVGLSWQKHAYRFLFDEYRNDNEFEGPWGEFLSMCAVFDPPRSELLRFADNVDFRPAPVGKSDTTIAFNLTVPPVTFLRDPDEAVLVERWYWTRVMEELVTELFRDRGIDITELALMIRAEIEPEYVERLAQIRPRPYLDPVSHPESTERDMEEAFKRIRAAYPAPPRGSNKPQTHSLVDVQCAIWRSEDHWSWTQLADKFGWETQEPAYPGHERRCETARGHVQEGLRLLRQK